MYDHDETVEAIKSFYRLLVSLVYPDTSALKEPPTGGWTNLNIPQLRSLGKNETVIKLLQHIPYFSSPHPGERLLLHYETIPIDYTQDPSSWGWDSTYPLPAHCVFLTRSLGAVGHNLILDTERGTITEHTSEGSRLKPDVSAEDLDAMPEAERWLAHRTVPAVEFFAEWQALHEQLVWMLVPAANDAAGPTTGRFYSRATFPAQEEELLLAGLDDWQPQLEDLPDWVRSKLVRVQRVYDAFRRHGWPDALDKTACRNELLELERGKGRGDAEVLSRGGEDL